MTIEGSTPVTPAGGTARPPLFLALPYGIYAVLLFTCLALLALAVTLVLPKVTWRRAVVRYASRTFFLLAGMRLQAKGLERLPAGNCVFVANHASYLDGVVLTAVLPPRFSFVIKREMDSVPLAGLLLRRIGAQFVDRGNRQRSGRDALRVLRAASSGQALMFFPEGTFSAEPGLLRFHAGAFVTAARAGFPVVPATIRGTRRALPAACVLPWPARIEVTVLEPLPALEPAPLREAARSVILRALGEPDLAVDPEPALNPHNAPGERA